MSKLFCIINTPTLPTPDTHYFTTNKFASGFEHLGYAKREIRQINDLDDIPDEESTIFMVSNHGVEDNWDVNRLKPLQRFTKAIKILWHFHSYLIQGGEVPFNNWILTGEHMHAPPGRPSHKKAYDFHNALPNYEPLTFSTYITPEVVGKIKRGPLVWDAQFVGTAYKTEWTSQLTDSFIRPIALSTSEETRVASFLQAHCALGFHNDANIANNVVVERVPEALGFGAVCLTDSPAAVSYTKGCAVLVSSLDDLREKIAYYKHNTIAAEEKRLQGYEWVRNGGTYKHVAVRFLQKFEELGYTGK